MLERVSKKGKPIALFVGNEIDIITMENSMATLKKLGIKTTI